MPETKTATSDTATGALRGPWLAVLSFHGDVLPEGELSYLDDDEEVDISIRRGPALPDAAGSLPRTYYAADEIRLWEDLHVGDRIDDHGIDARWAQAQAMAAGLNASAEAVAR